MAVATNKPMPSTLAIGTPVVVRRRSTASFVTATIIGYWSWGYTVMRDGDREPRDYLRKNVFLAVASIKPLQP